jgi:MoaA/NifB/PqqE/SkfB family radical SAM enzyme
MRNAIKNIKKYVFYLNYSVKFFLLRKEEPLILGLVITDLCNLSCKDCRVSNTGRPSLTMQQIQTKLHNFYDRGFRELYIEGGEPFLWKDTGYYLDDIIDCAIQIGYYHVHIYTNGLFPLHSKADILWVSIDGLKHNYEQIRGPHFEKVIKNIKDSNHPNIAIVYVINTINKEEIKDFLMFVQKEKLTKLGVMFYFHTPYYGTDDLFIPSDERKKIIEKIVSYKKSGLPVFNSYAGLDDLKTGNWKRPSKTYAITDVDGDYICCRYNSPAVCKECGYGACTEISGAQKFKPSAIKNLLRFW